MKKAVRRSNKKGFYYKRGAIAGFSPLSLAPSGLWLPFPANLAEDEDGTGSVEHSDTVGQFRDTSGSDDHLLQATASARPVYETSGGKHWLRSVSSDFMLAVRARDQPFERISAWRILTLAAQRHIIGGGDPGNMGVLYIDDGGTELRMFAGAELTGQAVPAQDVDFVVTERWSDTDSRLAVNNGSYVTGNTGGAASTALALFAGTGGTDRFTVARCYGIFERDGETLTDDQITSLRGYFSALCESPPL